MKLKAVSGIVLILLFVSFLATYRAETEDAETRVYVDPPMSSAAPGHTFLVDVVLQDVTDLYGWEFKLFWDNSILNCTDEMYPFFPEGLNWDDPNNIKLGPGIDQDYNETHGRYYRGLSMLPMSEPYPETFTGTMKLATLTFKVLDAGGTSIDLQDTKLKDHDAWPIYHTTGDGYFTNSEHEIAVFLEVPWDVFIGESVLLKATVVNRGMNDETGVEFQLLINGSMVNSTVVDLPKAGSSYTLSHLWTPIVKATFNVTAYALPVPDEEYTTNNVKSQMIVVYYEVIYIMADGRVAPTMAPISTVDNITYTFTDNIYDQIVVERDNITIDGAGYTLEGTPFGRSKGINLRERSNVTIKDMRITSFWVGIHLFYSSNNTISGNNITNNEMFGIWIDSSHNNAISGNNITNSRSGIKLDYSSNNILRDNSLCARANNNYNFEVAGMSLSDFVNDVDSSNTVDGKPTYYWINERDMAVPLDAGYVVLVNCTNITVQNLNLTTNNQQGVLVVHTTNSSITRNIITDNCEGIKLQFSSDNTISGNNVTNNLAGILLFYSSNYDSLSGNIITNNHYEGIHLYTSSNNIISGNNIINNGEGISVRESPNNIICHNNFVDNYEKAYNYYYSSVWDDGYPSGGNYWSDHVCTGNPSNGSQPYLIGGGGIDNYPFQDPSGWITPDINGDGLVDILDIITVGLAFCSYPAHPRWNAFADMNGDRIIDIFDLVLIAINFGKTA